MRQIRIAKVNRRKDRRYDDAVLPLDVRDPDIVRAKQAVAAAQQRVRSSGDQD
ncbi:hypothetical protein AB0E63_23460 [Kribbella sp. NPDC026596]|uniref:hypothetical protein n=1 Tax=Kribbella sp. NPDC026596 TaxID=3155122 RepID=UPI0033EB3455